MPNASRARLTRAGTALSTAQDAAGDRGEQLGLGCRALRHARAPCGLVDDPADENRDDDVEDEREGVVGVGDRDGEERSDEQVVEREAREDGGEEGGPDAADEGDDDDEQLVGQDIGRDGVGARRRVQQPGQERAADEGDREAQDAALDAQGPAGHAGEVQTTARGGVRHDVDIDVARLADDCRADAGAGQERRDADPGGSRR